MKPKEILIGAHTSAAGGVQNALLEGKEIGATTIQLFTSNQKQWKGKVFNENDLNLWFKTLEETGLREIMSHDSYLINLGSPKEEGLQQSRKTFSEELNRCQLLKISYLNFHPGAALDGTREECLDRIVESLLLIESDILKGPTIPLLECTAGQGTTVGNRFEEIAYVISRVSGKIPVGVCVDTCHAFSAGYDVRTQESWDEVLKEFDRLIGLPFLKAFHLNDSKHGLGSRKDRHENLGKGEIGLECFKFLMEDPRTRFLPKYLETPGGTASWTPEIELLKTYWRKDL